MKNDSPATSQENVKEIVLRLLSEQVGVDKSDISLEDLFTEDLHMSPGELTDFCERLAEAGFKTEIDFAKTPSVGELIEFLCLEEVI